MPNHSASRQPTSSAPAPGSILSDDTCVREVTGALELAFAPLRSRATLYGPEFSHFVDDAFHSLRGGKLLRPTLLMEAWDALSKDPGSADHSAHRAIALEIAAAIEFLHFSSSSTMTSSTVTWFAVVA